MSKELSEVEKLFDENNNDNIVLYDEENNKVEFEQIAVVPLNDEDVYAILKPIEEVPTIKEDEALVFHIEEIEDEDCLVIVDNDEVIDKVFDEYYKMCEEAGVEVPKDYKK